MRGVLGTEQEMEQETREMEMLGNKEETERKGQAVEVVKEPRDPLVRRMLQTRQDELDTSLVYGLY